MRLSFFAALAAFTVSATLAGTASAGPSYPPAGNIGGLYLSANGGSITQNLTVAAGQDIAFNIIGTGKCTITIVGIPNPILPVLTGSGGPWPLTLHGSVSKPGNYTVSVSVPTDPANPAWCAGSGQASLTVTGGSGESPSTAVKPPPGVSGITMTNLEFVTAPPGGAWRPKSDIWYAGEDFQVQVTADLPSSGYGLACAFEVALQNVQTGAITNITPTIGILTKLGPVNGGTTSSIIDVGIAPPGEYHVIAFPGTPQGASFKGCLGKAERTVNFRYQTAWVTGLNLYAFGYHFNAADNTGLPQFCSSCGSIFQPAHNSAFLEVIPHFQGATSSALQWSSGGKNACVVDVNFNGPNFSGNNGQIAGNSILYQNGQPAVPQADVHLTSFSTPPYWTQWDGDTNTVQVTLQAPSFAEVQYWAPPCNVLGNLSKTITFTDDPKKPPVSK